MLTQIICLLLMTANVSSQDADGDGVPDIMDIDPLDPYICGDVDGDACDDCAILGYSDPDNDGPDNDSDGICDIGDADDDNDNVLDISDPAPFDPYICGDSDGDGCDDCAILGYFDPNNDGPDHNGDGICDPTTPPTNEPTLEPTLQPTIYPTTQPTSYPTTIPTTDPTENPTSVPTANPTTTNPTYVPSPNPTENPTSVPTSNPTYVPTIDPTNVPTNDPSIDPTGDPTNVPTFVPTFSPTFVPTFHPTFHPTHDPTFDPTSDPTADPTADPTFDPTIDPTAQPTSDPTILPTIYPSNDPSTTPTGDPTKYPTYVPSNDPTQKPSVPSVAPITRSPTLLAQVFGELVAEANFSELVEYLDTQNITLPTFALNLVESFIDTSPALAIFVLNVFSGSIVIEYNLQSSNQKLIDNAVDKINNAVGTSYEYHGFVFPVTSNKITITQATQTTEQAEQQIDSSDTSDNSYKAAHKAVVILSLINVIIFIIVVLYLVKLFKHNEVKEEASFNHKFLDWEILLTEIFSTIIHWIFAIYLLLMPHYSGAILVCLVIIGEMVLILKYLLLNKKKINFKIFATANITEMNICMIGILLGNIEEIPAIIISIFIGDNYGFNTPTTLCFIVSTVSMIIKITTLFASKFGYTKGKYQKTTNTEAIEVVEMVDGPHEKETVISDYVD